MEFKNDTTLELRTLQGHMDIAEPLRMIFKCKKTNGNTLEVYNASISKIDSVSLINYGLKQYLNRTALTIEGKALTDNMNKLVYVVDKDFKRNSMIILVNGKVYKTKTNKGLKGKAASIKDDIDNYEVKIHRGWDAYKKFGYEGACGVVVELKRKM